MQMAQQKSADRDDAKLARHEWVSTAEPVSSSSGGEASWPWSIAPASSGFLSVGRLSCVLRVLVASEGHDLRGKGAEADRMGSAVQSSSTVCVDLA